MNALFEFAASLINSLFSVARSRRLWGSGASWVAVVFALYQVWKSIHPEVERLIANLPAADRELGYAVLAFVDGTFLLVITYFGGRVALNLGQSFIERPPRVDDHKRVG